MNKKPRALARPGLSLVDANGGRLVTYEQDVLDIQNDIRARWPGLVDCFFDLENEEWVITVQDPDGTERALFTTEALSQSTIDRIHRSDQESRSYEDPNKKWDQWDREEDRAKDRRFEEAIGEVAERLFFALRKDGQIHSPKVFFSNRG